MTFEEANDKAERLIRENPRQIYFIMGKNEQWDVFAGWRGRDNALKDGYSFGKYSMTLGKYTTQSGTP